MRLSRIGVFYDGGYFAKVSDYYRYAHPRGTRLSIPGLHSFARHEVSEREQIEVRYCQIVDAHYFRGRFPAHISQQQPQKLVQDRRFDDVLMRAGVTTHYLPRVGGEEKGIDVWMALEALELALYRRFDILVLVTGDGDYVPLARKLNSLGTRVMLLAWDCTWQDPAGQPETIRTSQALIEEATYAVMMHNIIDDPARRNDVVTNGLFLPPPPPEPKPASGSYPSYASYPSATRPNDENAAGVAQETDFVTGSVYSIHDTYGFVQDTEHKTWFFHKDNLVGVRLEDLQPYERVRFAIGAGPRGEQAIAVKRMFEAGNG